ncbi:unnamed protein product, partial [Prunus brigantina]
IVSSAFKKGLPTEHDLYCELTIAPNQTLAEVFTTAERYTLWDDDRIAARNRPNKTHGHYTNNYITWKKSFEELVREGQCVEVAIKKAIQQTKDHNASKEPLPKVIKINTILADSKESRLTNKEKKRKNKQTTIISQVLTSLSSIEDDSIIRF